MSIHMSDSEAFVSTTKDGSRPASINARLSYNSSDPIAVTITFFTPAPISWKFARDLLIDLMECDQAGEGDILFEGYDDDRVMITLRSPDGMAHILVDLPWICDFTLQTVTMIPVQSEGVIIETALNAALGG